MDFMTQLVKWNEVDTIIIVVIRFSKLAKMVPTKTITTFDSTKLLFDIWVIHHWILQFIIDDRNAKFMVGSYKHWFQEVVTKLSFNRTFHSQTKRVNQLLRQYLINYVSVNKTNLNEHLGLKKLYYNSTMHSMNKISLIELTLGKETRMPMDLSIPMGQRDHF
jgi:hypothetical protein